MSIFQKYNKSFINGEWTKGLSTRKVNIVNPYNDSVLSTVLLANAEQVADAFESANAAQKEWPNPPLKQEKK